MTMKSKQFLLEIEQVRRPLEAWRGTRKPGHRIPERLWSALVKLGRTYGISPVNQALRVDYNGLKRRVAGGQPARRAASNRPAFVEFKALQPSGEMACVVELEDRLGGKMTLRLAQVSGADALALAQAFWRRGA